MTRSSWWRGMVGGPWEEQRISNRWPDSREWVGEPLDNFPEEQLSGACSSFLIWVGAGAQWGIGLFCVKRLSLRGLSASREGSPYLRVSAGTTLCCPCLEKHSVGVDFCLLVYLPGTPQLEPFSFLVHNTKGTSVSWLNICCAAEESWRPLICKVIQGICKFRIPEDLVHSVLAVMIWNTTGSSSSSGSACSFTGSHPAGGMKSLTLEILALRHSLTTDPEKNKVWLTDQETHCK